MFYQLPFVINSKLYSSFVFNKNIGRCFYSFISNSGFHNSFKKTKHLTNLSCLNKLVKVFNCRLIQSGAKMLNDNCTVSGLRLSDYDCIGFDLDNTLCEYDLDQIIRMEYDALTSFLCEQRGYPSDAFHLPLDQSDMKFLQRGLLLDLKRGNILKVNFKGTILKAYHGTKEMSQHEIKAIYGEEKKWDVTDRFCQDMISTWNGPLATELRALLDFFDIPASLVFAQAVDYEDKFNKNLLESYKIGEHILASLVHIYKRDHYPSGVSKFFREMKANQSKYTLKCDASVIQWLKKLRSENKITFLLTGSNIDFASLSASYCLGEDWRQLFDIVICFARKPGFFISNLPFLTLDGFKESVPLKPQDLVRGQIYNQGNWKDLTHFFGKLTNKRNPRCIYFGDNVVQDVYTPSRFCGCDTVAVIEELNAEFPSTDSQSWLKSNQWGSYFNYDSENLTIWGDAIKTYSKLCIPSIKYIANIPLNTEHKMFNQDKNGNVSGFHPLVPVSLKQSTIS